MDIPIFLAFALAYLVLLVWGVRLAMRHGWWTPANLPLLVIAALVHDNAVLGLGTFIGEGTVLEFLSYARYWIHALITPTLVAWALHTLRRAGFGWAQSRPYQVLSIGAALALTVVEYFLEVRGLHLAPETEYGVLSYGAPSRRPGRRSWCWWSPSSSWSPARWCGGSRSGRGCSSAPSS